ncbi:hypothetical protein Tco_0086412 [Tanacetum coccineum]
MYGTVPPIPPPLGTGTGSLSNSNVNRVNMMPNTETTNASPTINVSRSVDDDLLLPQLLDSRGGSHITNVPTFDKDDFTRPSNTRDTKIAALRLKFNAFKALEGEKVNGLIDDIYASETQRFTIQTSSSKALIFNNHFQDNDSDVEEDNRTSNKFMADLNAEYHERALLENQKRFYKRSRRVGSARKPMDKSKETCFACGKLEDEGTTKFKAFMEIADDEPSVGKVIRVNLENESLKDEISDFEKVIEKWTCSKVTLDQFLSKQIPGNIVKALGRKGRRKENNLKEVLFTKADVSTSKSTLMITSDLEDDKVKGIKNQILIPLDTSSSVSQASSSKTLRQKVWYGPCKHCGMKNHLSDNCYTKPKCYTYGSCSHTTKEHTKQTTVRKYLNKLKGQSTSKPTPARINKMSKIFGECKYCGSNKHHPDDSEFYTGCEICRSIAHEIADCPKNLGNSRKQRVAIKQSEPTKNGCSRHMTGVKQYLHRYSKESGPKVVFGDNSSGDTDLCDANFKVLFTKSQGTIFNEKDEVVLIAPRRRDVYVIAMSSYNTDINACFYAKASLSVNWL